MENKFRESFEKSPIGILFFDKEGNLTDANQSALEIGGTPSINDVIGINIFNAVIMGSKKDELLEKGLIKLQYPVNFDDIKKLGIYNPTRSGIIFIDLTISVIDTGFLVQIQDITEQKKAEEALEKGEERYHSLFENNHAVMLLINPDTGDIIDANPAACSFYGYTKERLTKMKITDLNVLTDEQVFEEMKKAKSERKNHFIFKHRLSNGEIRDVDVYSGSVDINGESLLYSIIHDITKQIKAEEEFK